MRVVVVELDHHRRREVARERGDRLGVDAVEDEHVSRLGDFEHQRVAVGTAVGARRHRAQRAVALLGHPQFAVATIGADEPERQWNVKRRLACLAGRGRAALFELEHVATRLRVVASVGAHPRRAGLRIPAPELRKRDAVGVGDR